MKLRTKAFYIVASTFSIFIFLIYFFLNTTFEGTIDNRQHTYYMAIVMLCGVLYAIGVYLLLEKLILHRLHVLITDISNITKTQNLSCTLSIPGKDEIAALASTINDMLGILSTEKTLRQHALVEVKELNRSLEQRVSEKAVQLQKQMYTDQLTAIPNRFQLIDDLRAACKPRLAIINIDKFRTLNEFYGYQAGDSLLQELAYRLERLIEPYQYQLYRVAADEYAILADGEDEHVFSELILGIHDAIENVPFKIQGHSYYLFVTVGIAVSEDKLLEKAKMALEYARQSCLPLQLYRDDLPTREAYRNNLHWLQEVQDAIQENRIILYYQPIMETSTSQIYKYEVLVRLRDRAGEIISPGTFLPIIKKTKLYPRLTEVVIRKAFCYFADKNVDFSINLSAADILDNGVQELIEDLLVSSSIASYITFEFVESEEFEDQEKLTLFINNVKKYGVKIAIDDFGSGYSNFANILKMGANYIKIDGTLIGEIGTNPAVIAIVESIVYFAKRLGIKTIGEYVSSEAILLASKKIGLDYVQGYYVGEPQPYLVEDNILQKNCNAG